MANERPFDTSLWARPGIPMQDPNERPSRWYHVVIFAGLIFFLGYMVGSIG
jgi:hypothetical protein